MRAVQYDILRQIPADGKVKHRLERKPVRVATLLNEEAFMVAQQMQHNKTVFLEDRIHDWNWTPVDATNPNGPGDFRYYTRIAQMADVIVAYEVDNKFLALFDTESGAKLEKPVWIEP